MVVYLWSNQNPNKMKKYRPYKTFPDDIVGKVVMVNTGQVTLVYHLDTAKKLMQTTVKGYSCISAFEELTFTDGSPVGEEYDEAVELVHDEVYCVRENKNDVWTGHHFAKYHEMQKVPIFYSYGMSSKTSRGMYCCDMVAEYDEKLIDTTNEPKNGYIYKK